MRSSDHIEGPVFPGLKRIIIIISRPESGRELYHEREKESWCFSSWEEFQKLPIKWQREQNLMSWELDGLRIADTLFCVFGFALDIRAVCVSSAFEDGRWVTESHLWSNGTCLADAIPKLWSGLEAHRFYHGHWKPHVSFFHRLTAPCVITPFIYMDIRCVKKGAKSFLWRLINLSCSKWGILLYLSWIWFVRPLISASSRKLTRPDVAQQECPCRKRTGSVKGKTSPIFPSFASKLSWTALTYSLGPGFGWHGGFGLLAATQSCHMELWMAGVCDKGQSCHVLPNSFHAVFFFFFHMGASLHARRGATWSRGGVPVNQHFPRGKAGMADVSAVPFASSVQETQSKICKNPLLYLLSHFQRTHQQGWGSDGGQAHTGFLITRCCYTNKTSELQV